MRMLKLILLMVCLWSFTAVESHAMKASEQILISKFIEAGKFYKEGDYRHAIQGYEEIIRQGFESGALYYNLGNSYFKNGDLGTAILNYERSRRFLPRDSDLNFNYHYARRDIDKLRASQKINFIDRATEKFIQITTADELVLSIILIVSAMGILHLVSLYGRWPNTVRGSVLGLLAVFLIIYSAGFVIKIQQERNSAVIVVETDSKFEPRDDSTTHFQSSVGMKVKILKVEGGWVKIRRFDGKIGWVLQDTLANI